MSIGRRIVRWATARGARRLARSLPVAGAAVAIAAAGFEIRRKGLFGGTVETALNATPFVGAAKNVIEMFRGDLIPDQDRPARPNR